MKRTYADEAKSIINKYSKRLDNDGVDKYAQRSKELELKLLMQKQTATGLTNDGKPQFAKGGSLPPGDTLSISDSKEFLRRKQAYNDSMMLHNYSTEVKNFTDSYEAGIPKGEEGFFKHYNNMGMGAGEIEKKYGYDINEVEERLNYPDYTNNGVYAKPTQPVKYAKSKLYGNGGSWAYDAMQFAPVAYNLIQGLLPEKQLNSEDYQVPANIKPYEVDYAPERQQLESSKNALNTEIMNTGNKSTGDIIRNLRASDTSYRNNLSQIYNQQGQQNAAIDMQTKQFNTGIKQQNASTRFAVDDWNQKSYAAKQNMLGSAATNLGAYGQGKASDQTGMNLITSILGEDWDYVNGKLVKRKKVQ